MKVYFAGSIRGGRDDAELYHRIITRIQETDTVLTEHVGAPVIRESSGDAEIYAKDTAWLREADLLIGECTCPSLGVGYELAYAERYHVPAHIFYNRTKTNLSAMLSGNGYFQIHPYENEAEIYPVLQAILENARELEKSRE